jgi:hypothetical protein
MATTLITGSIPLNGTNRVQITAPELTLAAQVVLKGASGGMAGQVVVSEVTPGEGFGISSTDSRDVGQIVYFEVVETVASRAAAAEFEAMKAAQLAEVEAFQAEFMARAAAAAEQPPA